MARKLLPAEVTLSKSSAPMVSILLIASVLVPLVAATQDAPKSYSCGPFLLQPGTDVMTLVVDQAKPVVATLEWGVVGQPPQRLEHSNPERHHIFELTGLTPNCVYNYRISTNDRLDSGPRQFRTLPVAPESYRIITVGDVRSQPAEWGRVSRRIVEHESDALFMIGTGDYPSDGRKYPLWILQFFRPARDLLARIPLWPAIGNHEATRPAGSTKEENSKYFSLFELPGNEHWYRVDYHLLTLLIVDSNSHCDPASEQYKWLRSQLRSRRARYTLVAFHHAPYTSGPHGKVELDGTPKEWPLDEGQRFLVPLFEMYGVDLVLNGHDHLYERSEKDGLTYIVTGGGGAPLYKVNSTENRYQQVAQSKHHYVALDIDAEKIVASAIDVQGDVFDQVTVPVSAARLRRRHALIARELSDGLEFGPIDPATLLQPFAITHRLDHDLSVAIRTTVEGVDLGEDSRLVLTPGVKGNARLDFSWLRTALEAEPWTADVAVPLQFTLDGQDQAQVIHVALEEKIFLRRKHYSVATAPPPILDGELSEWSSTPSMSIGPGSQIVEGAASYDGSADCLVRVRSTRSATHLFVSLDVTDDSVSEDSGGAVLDQDGVHFLFASTSDVEARKANGKVSMHSVTADGRVQTKGKDTSSLTASSVKTDAGYAIEARMLLTDLPVDKDGHVGLDILLSDRDGQSERTHLRLWSNETKMSNPAAFGFLFL